MVESTPTEAKTPCPISKGSFNFCFWSKLIVAIPALPLAAMVTGSLVEDPALKLAVMVATIGFLVWAAIKIDRMPALSGKVVHRAGK